MAVSPDDLNQIRVNVLGTTVDAPGAIWTPAPPPVANTLTTEQRVINRAINDLDGRLVLATASTDGFATRFNEVVGDEAVADHEAFDSFDGNLIRAVAALLEGDGGGDGAVRRHVHHQSTPETSWAVTHDLGERLVAVQLVDEAGRTMLTDIDFHSDDALTVHFAVPKAGTAVIRR